MTPPYTPSFHPFKQRACISERWNKVLEAVNTIVENKSTNVRSEASILQDRLNKTVTESWPRRYYSRYREVTVLLTYWADPEDSTFGADKAAKELAEVFTGPYGFDVQIWPIPTIDQPQQFLAAKLAHVVRSHGKKDSLLLFWYGGSSETPAGELSPILWYGERWGGRINSGIVPQILGSGDADVLTLYDCPNSLHGQGVTGGGIFEHLGASLGGDVASFGRPGSFTGSLLQILRKPESAAFGLAVLDLHRKSVNRARRFGGSPQLEKDVSSVYSRHYIMTRSWLSSSLAAIPVYCHLSVCTARSSHKPLSIVLSNLNYPLEASPCRTTSAELEVELKLKFRGEDADTERWREWVLASPAEVTDVAIQVA